MKIFFPNRSKCRPGALPNAQAIFPVAKNKSRWLCAGLLSCLCLCSHSIFSSDDGLGNYSVPDQPFVLEKDSVFLAGFNDSLEAIGAGGSSNEGILAAGEAIYEEGKFGKAFLSSEQSRSIISYFGVAAALNTLESGTLEFWFRNADSQADSGENAHPPLWSSFNADSKCGIGMTLGRSNNTATEGIALYFQSPTEYVAIPGQVLRGDWNHVGLTWRGASAALFVNGVFVKRVDLSRPVKEWWGDELVIGSNQYKLNVPFCLFDDFRISDTEKY